MKESKDDDEWIVSDTASVTTKGSVMSTASLWSSKMSAYPTVGMQGFPLKKIKKKVLTRKAKERKSKLMEKALETEDVLQTKIAKKNRKRALRQKWKNIY